MSDDQPAKSTSSAEAASAKPASARPEKLKSEAVHKLHLWEFQALRDALLLLAGFGLVWLGWRLSSITVPMLIALGLSYICEPLIQKLQSISKQWTRNRSVVTVMIGVILVLLLTMGALLVLVVPQAKQLVDFASKQYHRIEHFVTTPVGFLGENFTTKDDEQEAAVAPVEEAPVEPVAEDEPMTAEEIKALVAEAVAAEMAEQQPERTGPTLEGVMPSLKIGGRVVLGAVGNIIGFVIEISFGIFLVGFFFLIFSASWPGVLNFGNTLLPSKHKDRIHHLIEQMDVAVAGFVRGRLLICALLGIVFGLGWSLVGVPHAIALGLIVALLTLIPYASGLGLPMAWLLLYGALSERLDVDGFYVAEGGIIWWKFLLFPALIYGIAQTLDDWVLSPKIQGDATGLDTATIIVAVMAGGNLMGMYGMLLAIPIAACIKILLTEELWPRVQEWLDGTRSDPLPLPGSDEG